ncbi:MAG: PIN domain-containing protein [Planctomyces sp.]|nr:PIN domain-containing protein [Planctomyces sp.]
MTIPPADLVLIDTCIWVGFFNRAKSTERMTVDPLLDDDQAAITGMILAEILQGFRRDDQADWVASSLKGLHALEPTWDDWRFVAKLGRQLIASGHRLPLTDLAIAAIALRNDCFVLTTDPHFDLIAGLKRFPLQ